MTAHQRVPPYAVAMAVLASAALAVDSSPVSWVVAVTLAVLPGLAIVWLQPHSAHTWLGQRPMPLSLLPGPPVVVKYASGA